MNDDELLAALGIKIAPPEPASHTPEEERIIAGFEDILRFQQTHGRAPRHGGEGDIFERLYAVRLERLRQLPKAQALLAELDAPGLLHEAAHSMTDEEALDGDALLAELGVSAHPADRDDITALRHVRSHAEKKAAEQIADRKPCADFAHFKPLFDEAEAGLESGEWMSKPFGKDASIELGDFFILGGQIAYAAEMLDSAKTGDGRDNPRLRVIFGNQTESDLLLRSLLRSLYPDGDTPVGRRLVKIDLGPLFGDSTEAGDIESGTIYVLRSLSDHPFVAEHRELIHKIGVTGGKVETRIANAEKDATYLLAKVEVVATYKLAGIQRGKLENLFHRIFATAQLDLTIQDRFGHPVKPREWFLVPLSAVDEAVRRILDGSMVKLVYDPASASLVRAE